MGEGEGEKSGLGQSIQASWVQYVSNFAKDHWVKLDFIHSTNIHQTWLESDTETVVALTQVTWV